MARTEHYWLRLEGLPWKEVTRTRFIEAERDAGFHPTGGRDIATSGFSENGTEGPITYGKKKPRP